MVGSFSAKALVVPLTTRWNPRRRRSGGHSTQNHYNDNDDDYPSPFPRVGSGSSFRSSSHSTCCQSTTRNDDTTTTTFQQFPSSSSSSSQQEQNQKQNHRRLLPYDWQQHWYALTFASYVPNPSESAEAVPAAVFGHPLVLWKSRDDGPIYCADDVCPHRSAALSEGRVRNGKLECQYHGWQFQGGGDEEEKQGDDDTETTTTTTTTTRTTNVPSPAGSCTFIPQLEPGARIPKRACLSMRQARVVEGIVWVWMGIEPSLSDTNKNNKNPPPPPPPPRQGDGLDPSTGTRPGFVVNDFQIDLPYDHSYLVENLLDPAHIPISHDRTSGGGKRETAQAYDMHVEDDDESSSFNSTGFIGRYRTITQQAQNQPFMQVEFQAPGIIRQYGTFGGNGGGGSSNNSTTDTTTNGKNNKKKKKKARVITFGAALHCMPLGLGRSRLLFRVYFGGLPPLAMWLLAMKPQFLKNLNSCKILEQDVGLITTQEDHFARQRRLPSNRPRPTTTAAAAAATTGRGGGGLSSSSSFPSLADDYLLLKSSDTLVEAYRKWMDQVGHGMPWFQGLATRSSSSSSSSSSLSSSNENDDTTPTKNVYGHLTGVLELSPALDPFRHRGSNELETRYHRHVMKCPTTRNALQAVQYWKRICGCVAVGSMTVTSIFASWLIGTLWNSGTTSGAVTMTMTPILLPLLWKRAFQWVIVPAIPISTLLMVGLHQLEQRFYTSFKRKTELRTQQGL
jgi:phenylpropionate dioxygenase-like ring-hydroxylating dioxygenase large terminal subunit